MSDLEPEHSFPGQLHIRCEWDLVAVPNLPCARQMHSLKQSFDFESGTHPVFAARLGVFFVVLTGRAALSTSCS